MSGQQRSSFDSDEHDARDSRDAGGGVGGGCHGRLNSDLHCPQVSNVAQGKILYHNHGINK